MPIGHDMSSVEFRPQLKYRWVLIVGWPTQFGMIPLIGIVIVLFVRGGGLGVVGVLAALIAGWGAWRAWNTRLAIVGNRIVVANQIRTYVIDVDAMVQFDPISVRSVGPLMPGVAVAREGV